MRFHHRRITKRVAAFTTAFATAAFLVQLAMPSASAATAPTAVGSFFPRPATFTRTAPAAGTVDMAILSDKGDGVDTVAHLTAVTAHTSTTPAVTGATLVNWYYCDSGSLILPGKTGNTCTSIGTDTSATRPVKASGYGGGTIDDSWSITWDIPVALDNLSKNIVVEGCNGTADSTHSNCTDDPPEVGTTGSSASGMTVLLDDSSGGATPQTSSGEITAPTHGSASPTGADATLKASTSPELTAVHFGVSAKAGSGDDADSPNDLGSVDGCTTVADTTPDSTTATARTWSGTLTSGTCPNEERALTLYSASSEGVASAICTPCTTNGMAFDRHYIVREPGAPGTTTDVFLKQTSDVTADPTCQTGPSTIAAPAGSVVSLTGCTFDAFGTAVASEGVAWGLLAGGTGFFTTTPPTTTDTKGQAVASVSAPSTAAGTNTTVHFCLDHDANGVCDTSGTPPTETAGASLTISWSTVGGGHARSITLRLKDALVARGKVTAAGFAACANSVPVRVQRRVSGHWKTVKKTTTSATGAYRAHLRNRHGRYRSLAPKVTKGTDVCSKAVSPTRRH